MPPPDVAAGFCPPERLTTLRLLLRRPVPADAPRIYDSYARDFDVVRYLTWRPHQTITETQDRLSQVDAAWSSGAGFSYAITELGRGDGPIGMIDLRPAGHVVSFGYVLARAAWNKGFAGEALTALVELSLAQPGIYRAFATCDVDNAASARVLEKAGMQFEGVMRRHVVHPNIGDEPRDAGLYARVA